MPLVSKQKQGKRVENEFDRRRKPNFYLIKAGAILTLILGYFIGGAYEQGIDIVKFMDRFNEIYSHPFNNYFRGMITIKSVLTCEFVYTIVVIMYYTSQRNLMPGKEYGTAQYANVDLIRKKLEEPGNRNRIYSNNVKMSLNTRFTHLNNNTLIIGGAGSGKTFYVVKPNLMEMPDACSFVITDPKAEILRATGHMLKKNGYEIKVLNLIDMNQSDCYNPFTYIREETDVIKLITNLISNTTPKDATSNDPFWDKAESMFLQSLFYYVWMEYPKEKQNFRSVLELISKAEVSDKNEASELTRLMEGLLDSKLGADHPAYKQYMKVIRGAGDTVRSIIISANSRLALLENNQVLRVLSRDEMNIADLGIGKNGDGKTKTALFCVIPDNDKSYNFIIGMLYTQIFQELYYQADFECGGKLPIHVTFLLDEFANVALPDDYCSLLSTMRSREISSIIIIQNLAQIKALFKDTWETIPGNCDTLIYLGGNEQSTHKYISELLGKGTIDKRTNGETRGMHGSASRNYDVLGRELMTPDETRKMDNAKCLIFIRGYDPIIDYKYVPFNHPNFSQTEDGGAPAYNHKPKTSETKVSILPPSSKEYWQKLKEKGEVEITTLSYKELILLDDTSITEAFTKFSQSQIELKVRKQSNLVISYGEENGNSGVARCLLEDTVEKRLLDYKYTKEQKEQLSKARADNMPEKSILKFFQVDYEPEQMEKIRLRELRKLQRQNTEGGH